MPDPVMYDEPSLPANIRWQAIDFVRIQWPGIFSGPNRLHPNLFPESARPLHFVVSEDDVLISYATVLSMQLDHAGSDFKVYGLANVLTYPSLRREGHGSRVVASATRYIEASDADVAALFCAPHRVPFYARQGWQAMEGATTLVGPPDNPTPHGPLRMMLFVSATGKEARELFQSTPWYIGDPW